MLVTGSCAASIAGQRNGRPVYLNFARPYFHLLSSTRPLPRVPVGVSGWNARTAGSITSR